MKHNNGRSGIDWLRKYNMGEQVNYFKGEKWHHSIFRNQRINRKFEKSKIRKDVKFRFFTDNLKIAQKNINKNLGGGFLFLKKVPP